MPTARVCGINIYYETYGEGEPLLLIAGLSADLTSWILQIVEFSKKLGMKTIAEYVENEEIFKLVKELGIDYSQGYYFSEPKEVL